MIEFEGVCNHVTHLYPHAEMPRISARTRIEPAMAPMMMLVVMMPVRRTEEFMCSVDTATKS